MKIWKKLNINHDGKDFNECFARTPSEYGPMCEALYMVSHKFIELLDEDKRSEYSPTINLSVCTGQAMSLMAMVALTRGTNDPDRTMKPSHIVESLIKIAADEDSLMKWDMAHSNSLNDLAKVDCMCDKCNRIRAGKSVKPIFDENKSKMKVMRKNKETGEFEETSLSELPADIREDIIKNIQGEDDE